MNKGKSDAFDCVIFLLEQYNKFDIMKERNVLMYEIEFYENSEGFSEIKEYIMQLRVISEFNKDIRVEGHTDNIPINSFQFPSNWELSTQRAVNVIKYFIEEKTIDASRLSAVGYGEYHPIADNVTFEGRQANRRVDIVILKSNLVNEISSVKEVKKLNDE